MYRSINQLSQAKVMKKNAIFTFIIFVAIIFYLILTISHKKNEKPFNSPSINSIMKPRSSLFCIKLSLSTSTINSLPVL